MTRAYVLRVFRQAGFPLSPERGFRYESSVIRIRYQYGEIQVLYRERVQHFQSPAKALRWIRGRLAMRLEWGNSFALNRPVDRPFSLVMGGAA